MKKFLSAILATAFVLTTLVIPTVSATKSIPDIYMGTKELITEDFEDFAPGEVTALDGYTITGEGTYSIVKDTDGNQYFSQVKPKTTANSSANLGGSFTPQTDKFGVSFDMMNTGEGSRVAFYLRGNKVNGGGNGTVAIGVMLGTGGKLEAYNNNDSTATGQVATGLTQKKFHHIRLEVDVPSNTFKIWANGTQAINPATGTYDWSFRQCLGDNKRGDLRTFAFSTDNVPGTVGGAIDNIEIYQITDAMPNEYLAKDNYNGYEVGETPQGFKYDADKEENFKVAYDETLKSNVLDIDAKNNVNYFMNYTFGDRTDTLICEFDYKLPIDNTRLAVYFLQGGTFATTLVIKNKDIGEYISFGGLGNQFHTLYSGTNNRDWQHMKMVLDIQDGSVMVWNNGKYLGITAFRNLPSISKITGLNFGVAADAAVGKAYIDNFSIRATGTSGAVNVPAYYADCAFDGSTSLPSVFSSTTGDVTVAGKDGADTGENKVMKLVSSTSGNTRANFNHGSIPGDKITYSFDYRISSTGKVPYNQFYLNDKTGTSLVSVGILRDKVQTVGTPIQGSNLNTTAGTSDAWHNLKIHVDKTNYSYTVQIDDAAEIGPFYFRAAKNDITSGFFGINPQTATETQSTYQIDNYKVEIASSNPGGLYIVPSGLTTVNYLNNTISGIDFSSTVSEFLATLRCRNAVLSVVDEYGNAKTSGFISASDTVVATGTRTGETREYTIIAPYKMDIYSIDVDGDEYFESSVIDKAGDAKLKVLISNNTTEAITPVVAAATYSDGKMVSLDRVEFTSEIAANKSEFCDFDIKIPDLDTDATVKLMLWDGADEITPLSESVKRLATTDGKYSMPNIFCNGMVLQRNSDVNIFGIAPTGATVTVEFGGETVTGTAKDARFNVKLPVGDANATGQVLKVTIEKDGEVKFEKTISDVLIGDVYYGSGQSNMQMTIGWMSNKPTEVPDNFRYFKSSNLNDAEVRVNSPETLGESWVTVNSSNLTNTGALAYFMVKSIRDIGDIDVPIGFINSSQGATSIRAWIDVDTLYSNPAFEGYRSIYLNRQVDTYGVHTTDMYYNMARTVIPYTIKAAVWYQGEADVGSANNDLKIKAMIEMYREAWGDDIPYFIMQLPGFGERTYWDNFRLQQWNAGEITDKTYVVVNSDGGQANDIHPQDKDVAGERLARQVLKHIYGQDIPYTGPVYKSASVNGSTVTVEFDFVNDGIHGGLCSIADNGSITTFELSEDGTKWYAATATISGDSVVLVSEAAAPKFVRYSYKNDIVKSLGTSTNGVKLPAVPFSKAL